MSLKSEEEFVKDIDKDPYEVVNRMLGTINCVKSECFNPSEKEQSHTAIQRSVGILALNSKIFEVMREWVVQTYQKEHERRLQEVGFDNETTLSSMNNLVLFFQDQGRCEEAEPLLSDSSERRRVILGEDYPDTLNSVNNLAGLFGDQGKYSQVEALLSACLEKQKSLLGLDHSDTLQILNNLATVNLYQGKFSVAEKLLSECLEKRRGVLAESNPVTLPQ